MLGRCLSVAGCSRTVTRSLSLSCLQSHDIKTSKFSDSKAFRRGATAEGSDEKAKEKEDPVLKKIEEARSARVAAEMGGFAQTDLYRNLRHKSIAASFLTFIIYLMFREPTDDDFDFERPLWKQVPWMERERLEGLMAVAQGKGEPTLEFEKRLAALERMEADHNRAILQKEQESKQRRKAYGFST